MNTADTEFELDPDSGTVSGRILIISILSISILMAGFAWWHQKHKGRRTLEFLGSRVALQLRYGDEIELWKIRPANGAGSVQTESDQSLTIDGVAWDIEARRSIGKSPGMVHARQALVFDASYEWDAFPHESPDWRFALRFADTEKETEPSSPNVLLFDLKHAVARRLDDSRCVQLTIAGGLQKFFDEKLSAPEESKAIKP